MQGIYRRGGTADLSTTNIRQGTTEGAELNGAVGWRERSVRYQRHMDSQRVRWRAQMMGMWINVLHYVVCSLV